MAEKFTIELVSGLTPKNGGKFALVNAKDIYVAGKDKRLDAVLDELNSGSDGLTILTERVQAVETKASANEGNITTLQGEVAKKTEIDDSQAASTKTYSSEKVESQIAAAKQAVKDDLLGGVGSEMDTLKEVADALKKDADALEALKTVANGHVKFNEAQSLETEQKKMARDNIGAADAVVVTEQGSTLETVKQTAEKAASDIVTINNSIGTLQSDMTQAKADIVQLKTDVAAADKKAGNAATAAAAAQNTANTATEKATTNEQAIAALGGLAKKNRVEVTDLADSFDLGTFI